MTEHNAYEIYDWRFGGEEAKNAEMEHDRKEWWGWRDTQQGVGQDSPPHISRLPLKKVNDATILGQPSPCCTWEKRQTDREGTEGGVAGT